MKKILGYAMLFLLMGTGMQAQDFDLDDIMGEAQDFFGNATETAENEADDAAWENINNQINKKLDDPKLKKLMGGFSEALKKFEGESMTGKCLQIMGAYAELLAYCDMRAESETEPCKKKEWLGIESMILLAGTSINYCPQEFYGLADFDDPDEETQREIITNYEWEIRNYFFGNSVIYGGVAWGENFQKLKEIEQTIGDLYNKNLSDYLRDNGKKKYSDLTMEEKEVFNLSAKKLQLDLESRTKNELPHMLLYLKFKFANDQLKLNDYGNSNNRLKEIIKSDGAIDFLVDFVGKMFTPGYQVKKALEIASESSAQKCRN